MDDKERWDILPEQHILILFDKTENGKLAITYYPINGEEPYDLNYDMDWTVDDAKSLSMECKTLIATLDRLAQLHDEIKNEDNRKEILSNDELEVWETFVREFKPFKVEEYVIDELYNQGEFDELSEEENELLEQHYAWREADCLERLPFNRCSPQKFITRAKRYEVLKRLNAPEIVAKDEARCLAEEMVLYYCSKKKSERRE